MNAGQAPSDDEEREILDFIRSVKWKFAKTMPDSPHWYTMVQWCPKDRKRFFQLVTNIFNHGRDRRAGRWGRRTYRYLYIDEYQYWVMDPSIEETDLINRAYADGRKVPLSEKCDVMPGELHGE